MDALKLENVNAMPAATWRHLRMNDATVDVPANLVDAHAAAVEAPDTLRGEAGAFEKAVAEAQVAYDAKRALEPADTRAVLAAADGTHDPHDLNVPALSRYEQRAVQEEVAGNLLGAFETGMGADAAQWIDEHAGCDGTPGPVVLATQPHEQGAHATVRLGGVVDGVNAAAIDVVAAPDSELSLVIAADAPDDGTGVVASRLRVFAGAGARVSVSTIHTLAGGWIALDDEGYLLDADARLTVHHRVLGAGKAYTGLACDLRGDRSDAQIFTRYLGHGAEERDFNYVVRHRGRATTCNLDANGVLSDESRKVLRGTIDLVHGCKGAEGSERETVLLADERVVNKTIPVILCDEDDVAGNHGATIGHVRPEQLNYLMSRGISQQAAERLFADATLEEAAISAPDERVRASVKHLAERLGVPFELVGGPEDAEGAVA